MNAELELFHRTMDSLEKGEVRVATKENGVWTVHPEIKQIILSGFRLGVVVEMQSGLFSFFDKDTFPPRRFTADDRVRIVPGGSMVRRGAYLAPGVVVMPPSYINVGAWIGEGSMVDSNVIVGSCAQIGRHVHLGANCQVGGVLEPAGALPVIIDDEVFVGGGAGIYEGTVVGRRAVIASGVSITRSTPVYDAVNDEWIEANAQGQLHVPENAVVVSGSRQLGKRADIHVYMPVIIKYRDEKTDASVALEQALR